MQVGLETRPRFAASFVEHFLSRQTEKRIFGKPYIRMGPLLTTGAFLFESGGILASAFADRLEPFILVFSATARAEQVDCLV